MPTQFLKTRLSPFQKLKGVFEMRVVHSSTLWYFSELGCVIYKIPSYGFICHEIRAICWSQYNASQTQCRPAVHRQLLVCGGGRTIITISRTPSSVDCTQFKVCQVMVINLVGRRLQSIAIQNIFFDDFVFFGV